MTGLDCLRQDGTAGGVGISVEWSMVLGIEEDTQ